MSTDLYCPTCGLRLREFSGNPGWTLCKRSHIWERSTDENFAYTLKEISSK